MGEWTFIRYSGPDAGEVLVTMLSDDGEETHELETHTERRPIGFTANPEDEEEDDEPETD